MNLTEAEQLFKKYDGHLFHLFREEPSLHDEYKILNITSETEDNWRRDIINEKFDQLKNLDDRSWALHSDIISIIYGMKDKSIFLKQLLDLTNNMLSLDDNSKILVLENMAGRQSKHLDSGIFLFKNSPLKPQLKEIMKKYFNLSITDSDSMTLGWQNRKSRYEKAVKFAKEALNQL